MKIQELSDHFFIREKNFHIVFSKKYEASLSIKHPKINFISQIHGINSFYLNEHNINTKNIKADSIFTNNKNTAIGVYTADCIPLLFHIEKPKKFIGAIHAGWAGLANGIIENILNRIKNEHFINIEDINFYIGPHICKSCYSVSYDVIKKFEEQSKCFKYSVEKNNDNYKLDLGIIAENILIKLGIKNIFNINKCTKCDKRFYSYRNGDLKQRNHNFIWYEE